jgi:hypothetical protein
MAIIACPECAKEMSDKAPSCPHCGAPVPISAGTRSAAQKATVFKHPRTGERVDITYALAYTFLFGMFYFAVRGVWTHVIFSSALAIMTSGISWLIYPFFAKGILRRHLIRQGFTADA